MAQTEETGAWHLDKRVPVALIFAIIIQTATAVWWVSGVSHRVDSAISVNDQQNDRIQAVEDAANSQAVSTATTTAQLAAMRETLTELKSSIAETNQLLRELASEGARP